MNFSAFDLWFDLGDMEDPFVFSFAQSRSTSQKSRMVCMLIPYRICHSAGYNTFSLMQLNVEISLTNGICRVNAHLLLCCFQHSPHSIFLFCTMTVDCGLSTLPILIPCWPSAGSLSLEMFTCEERGWDANQM